MSPPAAIPIAAAQLMLAAALPALAAHFQLTNDPATAGPGQFAAEEIRREAAARDLAPVRVDERLPADAIQIKLSVEPEGDAIAQSYRIRVQTEGGRRSITVKGADAAGAMYGGLDIAEAIRTGTLDSLKWYPEACLSHRRHRGFYTVRHFMEGITMPGAKVLCIRDWRERLTARQPMTEITPLEIAAALDGAGSETFAALDALREASKHDPELRKTVHDCEALAWLGRYYAAKIRGACALALFDASGDTFEHEAALRHLGDALTHWKRYAAIRDAQYVPALYNRVGHVNVTELTEKVAADVELARTWKPGSLKDDGRRSGSEKGFRK